MPLDPLAIGRGCARKDHAGKPALRPRTRPLQGGACRRRANHGGVHPGRTAVPRSRGKCSAGATHLRQHKRNRRLVEGCGGGRSESRGADRGGRRRHAADLAGDAGERRRRADLWPRRDRDRGRPAPRRPSRHHRAAEQTRRRRAAPDQRISRAQGHHPQRPRPSRRFRACDRRLRAAVALLARETARSGFRAMAPPRPAT